MNNPIALRETPIASTGSVLMDDIHDLSDLIDQWTQPPLFAAEEIHVAEEDWVFPDGTRTHHREITITNPSIDVVTLLLTR